MLRVTQGPLVLNYFQISPIIFDKNIYKIFLFVAMAEMKIFEQL